VNLDGRADDLSAQVVSFLEKRMHVPVLHQGNEGNEEICCASVVLSGSNPSIRLG
jgi:hypothetical protein